MALSRGTVAKLETSFIILNESETLVKIVTLLLVK